MRPLTRRTMVGSICAGLGVETSACSKPTVTLAEVLTPARRRLLDGRGRRLEVDDLLAAAAGQTASLTFGYVGCGGPVSLLSRVEVAAARIGQHPAFNLVLDVVDEPSRYAAVVRDVIGNQEGRSDGPKFEIGFVEKDDLWPRQGSRTAQAILAKVGQPMRNDAFIQDIRHTALFDGNGRFIQIRFL